MSDLLNKMESDVKKPTIGDNSLKEMADLCAEQVALEEEMEQLSEQLKAKAASARKLSQEIIPARMSELGLESLTLADGSSIKIKQLVHASIPVKYREEAFQWLRDNGHGDIIKNQVSATFGKGEDTTASNFIDKIEELGYQPQQKVWVEPMTLKAARKLSQEIIPARMSELGLESLTLADGSSIKIKQLIHASIPVKYREEAFQWLRDNGHGDIIKNQVSATFGKGEDTTASNFIDKIEELGYQPQQKVWVEPMTLKAFVREQIVNGSEMPTDKFGVFIGAETKISKT